MPTRKCSRSLCVFFRSLEASRQRLRRDFPCTNRSMFEAINDQLDWLYGEMDLLLPSLYGMGTFTPAAIWIHHLCLTVA